MQTTSGTQVPGLDVAGLMSEPALRFFVFGWGGGGGKGLGFRLGV